LIGGTAAVSRAWAPAWLGRGAYDHLYSAAREAENAAKTAIKAGQAEDAVTDTLLNFLAAHMAGSFPTKHGQLTIKADWKDFRKGKREKLTGADFAVVVEIQLLAAPGQTLRSKAVFFQAKVARRGCLRVDRAQHAALRNSSSASSYYVVYRADHPSVQVTPSSAVEAVLRLRGGTTSTTNLRIEREALFARARFAYFLCNMLVACWVGDDIAAVPVFVQEAMDIALPLFLITLVLSTDAVPFEEEELERNRL